MSGELEKKFLVPPFSVLNTQHGYWQDRKQHWLKLGIKSELGRDAVCLPSGFDEEKYGKKQSQGTSIFDPVLCELMYLWFAPEKAKILDPFAGGSVRGIVAGKMGHDYTGIDLSEKQIVENIKQKQTILTDASINWLVGDSNKVLDELKDDEYDLIFSCPPYFNLEVYSDDIDELSNKDYKTFLDLYGSIIKKSLDKLKNNRFAIFVVSDVRDKKTGFYTNFVEDTVKIFEKNNVHKYNELILIKAIGTLPIRTSAHFLTNRKTGKMHENVLVFYKGDPNHIKSIYKQDNIIKNEKQATLSDW